MCLWYLRPATLPHLEIVNVWKRYLDGNDPLYKIVDYPKRYFLITRVWSTIV